MRTSILAFQKGNYLFSFQQINILLSKKPGTANIVAIVCNLIYSPVIYNMVLNRNVPKKAMEPHSE